MLVAVRTRFGLRRRSSKTYNKDEGLTLEMSANTFFYGVRYIHINLTLIHSIIIITPWPNPYMSNAHNEARSCVDTLSFWGLSSCHLS